MNIPMGIEEIREKIAREIFKICCPGYEFHDKEMYLEFAARILNTEIALERECKECNGTGFLIIGAGDHEATDKCPACKGAGLLPPITVEQVLKEAMNEHTT